ERRNVHRLNLGSGWESVDLRANGSDAHHAGTSPLAGQAHWRSATPRGYAAGTSLEVPMRLDRYTVKSQEALERAQRLAPDPQHPSDAQKALAKIGVAPDALLKALQQVRGGQRVTDASPEDKYQALTKYGRDLTAAARQGKLDPVIGRDEEIRRVVQVLAR